MFYTRFISLQVLGVYSLLPVAAWGQPTPGSILYSQTNGGLATVPYMVGSNLGQTGQNLGSGLTGTLTDFQVYLVNPPVGTISWIFGSSSCDGCTDYILVQPTVQSNGTSGPYDFALPEPMALDPSRFYFLNSPPTGPGPISFACDISAAGLLPPHLGYTFGGACAQYPGDNRTAYMHFVLRGGSGAGPSDTRQTVFLIHGIGQSALDMAGLEASLKDPVYGIDQSRFRLDDAFDFGYCANTPFCSTNCTIQIGAIALALYINQQNPLADIVLIGYSMGGLIARDMILNNYANVMTNHHVVALVTLGTPHLGYPYEPIDGNVLCNNLAGQMFGDFRNHASAAPSLPVVATPAHDFLNANGTSVALSSYLYNLNTKWTTTLFHRPDIWYAIAGTFCTNPLRRSDLSRGCRDGTPNDGVVCADSAGISIAGGPIWLFQSQYSHTGSLNSLPLFCDATGTFALFDPPKDGSVLAVIRNLVNQLPPPPAVRIITTQTLTRDMQNNVVVNLTITNRGVSTANTTNVSLAKISTTPALVIPHVTNDIPAGESASISIVFSGSVGQPGMNTVLTVGGTYVGGTFNFMSRLTLP